MYRSIVSKLFTCTHTDYFLLVSDFSFIIGLYIITSDEYDLNIMFYYSSCNRKRETHRVVISSDVTGTKYCDPSTRDTITGP